MKLTVLQWRDLASALDSLSPKAHNTTAEARKCIGSVEQIRRSIVDELAELENLQKRSAEIANPYRERIAELGPEKDDNDKTAAKRKKIVDEANAELKPLNDELNQLTAKFKTQEAEIELDANYKDYIKSIWEKELRPLYVNTKEMLLVADALGIK